MNRFKSALLARSTVIFALAILVSLVGTHFGWFHPVTMGLIPMAGMAFLDNESIVALLKSLGFMDAANYLRVTRNPVAKTANYQILLSDGSGTLFTNLGAAGAVTFTLPAISAALKGVEYFFRSEVGQNMTVAGAAGTVVTFNNAAATSVTSSTAGQLIGAGIHAICDGTKWIVTGTTVGVTYTVA